MRTRRRAARRVWQASCLGLGAAAVAVTASGVVVEDASATTTATADISGSTLTVTPPSSLSWSDTLDGIDQSVVDTVPTTVIDSTGSGSGWNLTISTTSLTSSSPSATFGGSLLVDGSSSSSTSSTAPSASCGTGSTCTLPTDSGVTYPLTVPTSGSAKFYSSASGTGLGTIDLATDFWLDIPANTIAATYSGTVTVAVSTGP